MHFSSPEGSAFVQDDFKFTPRLTVNMGLRWDYFGYVTNTDGNWSGVWSSLVNTQPFPGSSPATGSLAGFVVPSNFAGPVPAGVYQNSGNYLTRRRPPLTNFAPRLGFAWQPLSTNRWVIRGGGGIFYDRPPGTILNLSGQGAPPFAIPISPSPNSTLAVPFAKPFTIPGPADTPGWTPRWVDYSTGNSSNLLGNVLSQGFTVPVVYEWNLNTQYEFLPTWVLEVGYVGSRGFHQPGQGTQGYANGPPINTAVLASASNPICAGDGNPAHCVTTNTAANIPLRVPLLGFSPIFSPTDSSGFFKFNSLQASVRKQLSHGLTLQAAYTWSRAFVDVFQGINAAPGAQPWAAVYAQNAAYRPQRVIINYSWNIPSGNLRGVLGGFVSGWNLSGVTTIQDGTPLTITDTRAGTLNNNIGGGGPTQSAQFCSGMGNGNILASGSITQLVNSGLTGGTGYFNANVFCTPTGYGDVAPGIVLGPGQYNWDMSLAKTTGVRFLREGTSLQFRAEAYDVFNHPQFANPGAVANTGTFGRITSTTVSPRIFQLALKFMF
jgi:hypothetical protein